MLLGFGFALCRSGGMVYVEGEFGRFDLRHVGEVLVPYFRGRQCRIGVGVLFC